MNDQIQKASSNYPRRNIATWFVKIALVFVLLMAVGAAQTFGQTSKQKSGPIEPGAKPNESRLVIPMGAIQKRADKNPIASTTDKRIGTPSGRVKIIVKPNQLVITGAQQDIEIVKRAVAMIQAKMAASNKLDPQTSERVTLKFQMADVVATMLSSSLESQLTGPPVKVEALHFPESILLIGPKSSVNQAKKLLAMIDSHSSFKKRSPIPSAKRIY